ncbi:MAG TPA: phosphoribosylanthranilate isomerase [Lacipirellulaceae bacterium]|nr:phosphoribosylanthranilate isomerase [Lacipirellulaceae bacterium]
MFRIKICGITNVEDALAAVYAGDDAGADAIGLNFYPKSSRYIDVPTTTTILNEIPPSLYRVGVVVNEEAAELNRLIATLDGTSTNPLHAIQLHGDEPPAYLATVRIKTIIRARRFTDRGVAAIAADLEACEKWRRFPDAVLIDAAAPGQYGGTGTTVSWRGLADYRRSLHNVPLILAGGLTPDNVAEAIRIVRPAAVDVASGVESSPGKKDHAKLRDFIAAAREAFASNS